MRIEIDTKHDTKEELAHLAQMLMKLSGSGQTRVFEKPKHRDIFSGEPSSEPVQGGFFNLFNDQVEQKEEPASGGLMGMFDTPPSSAAEESSEEPQKDIVDNLKIVPY